MSLKWTVSYSYFLLTLLLVSGEVARSGSGEDEEDVTSGVKCVCDGGCEHLRGSDCPFGLTLDVCNCCLMCARGEGEPCGGAVGNCATGLHCRPDPLGEAGNSSVPVQGTCSKDEIGCNGELEVHFGCLIGPEGNCECSNRSGCPEEQLFLFETEEECRSKMAYLIAKKDLEVPAPQPDTATDDCSKVHCPEEPKPCPSDSYRLPSITGLDQEESRALKACCPGHFPLEKCQCIPGLHCSPPQCPRGSVPKLVENGTGEPGRCCSKFQCAQNKEEEDDFLHQPCKYKGFSYSSGETWSSREDCQECFCHNGVVSCKPIKCDLPADCRMAHTPPNSCCPVCLGGCVTTSGTVYKEGEKWEEDPCTSCTCNQGRVQCHAAMCQVSCSHPVHVPGECCPKCEAEHHDADSELSHIHHESCPNINCGGKACPTGFKLDGKGCPTCHCSCPVTKCDLQCPSGYQVDEDQCSQCVCRPSLEAVDKRSGGENGLKKVGEEGKLCKLSDGSKRHEGEEWKDQCRRCICRDGQEMCSLVTCHPPSCEHPIFFPGECCPRCPDEEGHINFSISVCQSSDGTERLEGESWGLGPCLKCTCHSGQVLCAAPTCPPTPCPNPSFPGSEECCPSCPHQNEHTSTTNNSSNCFSDDSLSTYKSGETWKVGACQSCVCVGGKVQCYSMGKCPALSCDKPVLVKNQCCPICIEHARAAMTPVPRGMEPYCALLIGMVLGLSLVVGAGLCRHFLCRRFCSSSSRLIKIKASPPSFHSSQETPPVTPDCCYKCDYNKYSSCAQLSEQKPLFNSSSSTSSAIHHSDKV